MTLITPMTLDDIQHAIHEMYEANASYVTLGDEDYTVRMGLINNWINRWANVDGTLWNELWAQVPKTGTGSMTYATGTSQYNAPAAQKFPGGFIRIVPPAGGTAFLVRVYPPTKAQVLDINATYAYFTGIPGSYVLNLNGVPASYNGGAMYWDYYKYPTKLAAITDIPEIPDPYFLVYGAVSQLHLNTRNSNGYTVNKTEAETRLSQMQVRNEMLANYQDEELEDIDFTLSGAGLGY